LGRDNIGDCTPPTIVAVAEATVASSSSFFSTPVLVGGILGIVLLAWIVAASHDTQIPATLEMAVLGNGNLATSLNEIPTTLETAGTLNTSVNQRTDFDDLQVSSAPRFRNFPGTAEMREMLAEKCKQIKHRTRKRKLLCRTFNIQNSGYKEATHNNTASKQTAADKNTMPVQVTDT
jgi:hypothetical protein